MKSPPRSATPPLSSVPAPNESYTPDRGSRPFGGLKQSPNIREMNHFVTPAKRLVYGGNDHHGPYIKTEEPRSHLESSPNVDPVKPMVQGLGLTGLKSEAANSPPTLYSDTATSNIQGNLEASRMNNALVTPLVSRHAPRLAPPSTAQMPSQYMNFSSPAPFWKFVDLPSTPAKFPIEFSPTKMHHDEKDNEEDLQPSSPPMLPDDDHSADPEDEDASDDKPGDDEEVGVESPSRTVSRPVSRRDLGGNQRSRSNSNVNILGPGGLGGMVRGASLTSFEEPDEPEEESYDLSK